MEDLDPGCRGRSQSLALESHCLAPCLLLPLTAVCAGASDFPSLSLHFRGESLAQGGVVRIKRESWRTPCAGKSHLLLSGYSRRPCDPCPPVLHWELLSCWTHPHPTHTHQARRSFKVPLLLKKTSPEGLINGSHDSRRQLAPWRLLRLRAGSLTCWPRPHLKAVSPSASEALGAITLSGPLSRSSPAELVPP